MAREADVVRSLVEMADTLVEDYDVVDLLTGLADRCVHLLGVSRRRGDAGFSRGQPGAGGLLQRGDAAAGAVRAAGPGGPVPGCLPDRGACRARGPAGGWRWPSFSAAAVQAGFASASALRCGCGR